MKLSKDHVGYFRSIFGLEHGTSCLLRSMKTKDGSAVNIFHDTIAQCDVIDCWLTEKDLLSFLRQCSNTMCNAILDTLGFNVMQINHTGHHTNYGLRAYADGVQPRVGDIVEIRPMYEVTPLHSGRQYEVESLDDNYRKIIIMGKAYNPNHFTPIERA